MNDKTIVQINDKLKKCTIIDIDDTGILVEYYKYNSKDFAYYSFSNIIKIKPILPED